MPPGKRKSPFIGRVESEDTPVLYQRFTKKSDLLKHGLLEGEKPVLEPGNEPVEAEQPSKKKAKKKSKMASLEAQTAHAEPDQPVPVPDTEVADNVQQNGKEDEPDAAVAQDGKKKKKGKKSKLKAKAAPSGPSNAEEAQAIRGILGFAKPEKAAVTNGSFGFNFAPDSQANQPVETAVPADETETAEEAGVQPPEADGNDAAEENEDVTDNKVRNIMGLQPLHVPRRIFVGGMPFHFEEDDVREYWSYCGEIESVDLMRFPDTGRFKGIAFITFAEDSGYKEALKYNGEFIDNQQLKVEKCVADTKKSKNSGPWAPQERKAAHTQPAPKTEGYNVAYVGNVAFDAGPAQLKEVFQGCRVQYVRLHTDKETKKPKGFAHVHFEDEESLDKAMTFNGTELLGRQLRVGYAQPKRN